MPQLSNMPVMFMAHQNNQKIYGCAIANPTHSQCSGDKKSLSNVHL